MLTAPISSARPAERTAAHDVHRAREAEEFAGERQRSQCLTATNCCSAEAGTQRCKFYSGFSVGKNNVQFKMLSVRLEKPICAPPCLSEVSPTLPLKTLRGEDFSGERQLGGCLAAVSVLKLALGNVSCQGLVLLEN